MTRITAKGSSNLFQGTVIGSNSAEVRQLTVENTGGTGFAVAIFIRGVSPTVRDVTVLSSGSTSTGYGILVFDGGNPLITDVMAKATGPATASVPINVEDSSVRMVRVQTSGSGASNVNRGMTIRGAGVHEVRDLVLHAEGAGTAIGLDLTDVSGLEISNIEITTRGATTNVGVTALASTFTIADAIITATGGDRTRGIENSNTSLTLHNSMVTATGGTESNWGLVNGGNASGPFLVTLTGSRITADERSVWNAIAAYDTRLGGNLIGGSSVVVSAGTVACAGNWNDSFIFFASACP